MYNIRGSRDFGGNVFEALIFVKFFGYYVPKIVRPGFDKYWRKATEGWYYAGQRFSVGSCVDSRQIVV